MITAAILCAMTVLIFTSRHAQANCDQSFDSAAALSQSIQLEDLYTDHQHEAVYHAILSELLERVKDVNPKLINSRYLQASSRGFRLFESSTRPEQSSDLSDFTSAQLKAELHCRKKLFLYAVRARLAQPDRMAAVALASLMLPIFVNTDLIEEVFQFVSTELLNAFEVNGWKNSYSESLNKALTQGFGYNTELNAETNFLIRVTTKQLGRIIGLNSASTHLPDRAMLAAEHRIQRLTHLLTIYGDFRANLRRQDVVYHSAEIAFGDSVEAISRRLSIQTRIWKDARQRAAEARLRLYPGLRANSAH